MPRKRKDYVSETKIEEISRIIENAQKARPLEPVTKAFLIRKLNEPAIAKRGKAASYRLVARAFKILESKNRIVHPARGQYWLPENLEKNKEYWKRKCEVNELIQKRIEPILQKMFLDLQEKLFHAEQAEMDLADQIENQRILNEEIRKLAQFKWR